MLDIGNRLKHLRKANNITQKQLATHLDIYQNSYQVFEYNKARPTYENLIKLCQYLNVSADYLLGLTDEPRPLRKEDTSDD